MAESLTIKFTDQTRFDGGVEYAIMNEINEIGAKTEFLANISTCKEEFQTRVGTGDIGNAMQYQHAWAILNNNFVARETAKIKAREKDTASTDDEEPKGPRFMVA